MTIRTFFAILAVLSVLFGIGFVLAPAQVLANYGIEHSPALALLGRLFGGALLTLGIILWLARDFRDDAAIRTVLVAALVGDAVNLVVATMGTLSGVVNALEAAYPQTNFLWLDTEDSEGEVFWLGTADL